MNLKCMKNVKTNYKISFIHRSKRILNSTFKNWLFGFINNNPIFMFDLLYITKRLNKTYEGCGFIIKEVLHFMQYKRYRISQHFES